MTPPTDEFKDNLRAARRRAGLSQDTLGDRCGLHRTEISLLERGGREPRLKTLLSLCKALRTTPNDLCFGSGAAAPEEGRSPTTPSDVGEPGSAATREAQRRKRWREQAKESFAAAGIKDPRSLLGELDGYQSKTGLWMIEEGRGDADDLGIALQRTLEGHHPGPVTAEVLA